MNRIQTSQQATLQKVMKIAIQNSFGLLAYTEECAYAYLPTPPLGQDMTLGQF